MEQLPLDGLEGRTLEKLSSAKDKKRDFPAKRIAAAAAAVMLLCATGALILSHTTQIELTNTQGRVSAHYTPFFPKEVNRANCLVNRTEEELFHTKNLAPFLGTVERIRNIRVDLNGAVSYRAIADVSVNKAYLGNVEPGSTVSCFPALSGGANGRQVRSLPLPCGKARPASLCPLPTRWTPIGRRMAHALI